MNDHSKPRSPRPPFNRKPFGNKGGFDRDDKQMFTAECASCQSICEVPFRPNGSKPVYCNNCFRDEAPRDNRRPSFQSDRGERPAPRPDQAFNDLKAELRVVNANLERLIAIMTPAAAPEAKAPKVVKKKTTRAK